MRMTEEERLKYCSDGIPNEILLYMSQIAHLVKSLEGMEAGTRQDHARQALHDQMIHAKARTEFYYRKRLQQFGIHNMRLKRLLDSFPSLLESFGFPSR